MSRIELLERMRRGQFGALKMAANTEPPPAPRPVLSLEQEMLWNHARSAPADPGRNQFVLMRLEGALDAGRLAAAMQQVVDRHDILRSSYPAVAGRPEVLVNDDVRVVLEPVALTAPTPDAEALDVRRRCRDLAQMPFDVGTAPLFRMLLFKGAQSRSWLFFVIDHLIFDGWSLGLVLRDLQQIYNGEAPPPVGRPFWLYAARERASVAVSPSADTLKHLDRLFGAPDPAPSLTIDYPGNSAKPALPLRRNFTLSARAAERIGSAAGALKTTPHLILLACLSIWVAGSSKKRSVLIYTPSANRQDPDFVDTVGVFRAPLLLRVDLDWASSFGALLPVLSRTVQEAARQNEAYPVSLQLSQAAARYGLDEGAIFNVGIVTQNFPRHVLKLAGLDTRIEDIHYGNGGRGISLVFDDLTTLSGHARYNGALFSEASVERMLATYEDILLRALSDPSVSTGELRALA